MEKINSHLVMSCAMSKIKYFPVFPAIVKEISIQYFGNVSNKGIVITFYQRCWK